ncbi:MAG TPA: MBL fold metallo-hydrolase [Bacillales bacterium]|nr:MBL fold metallo-hydrolase [Bacillales bacterium]
MIHYQNGAITVFQSALYKTTSTVIETEDLVLVTDPNWLPHEVEQIKEHVEQIKKDRPVYLLFTHSDFDHIIGYKAFPDAKVIASREMNENPDREHILEQIRKFDDQYYLERDYEIAYPNADIIIEADGQATEIGGTKLTFYKAPGHTPDGIFTIVEPLGIWIAGDYLSDVEFPFIYDGSAAFEETLLKTNKILDNHDIRLLVTGHGHVARDKREIQKRQQKALSYIRGLRKAEKSSLESLWGEVRFPRGMKAEHEQNIRLIKKEQRGDE